jgi:hypothetical protein
MKDAQHEKSWEKEAEDDAAQLIVHQEQQSDWQKRGTHFCAMMRP